MKKVRVIRNYQDEGTMFFRDQIVLMTGMKAKQLETRKLVEILGSLESDTSRESSPESSVPVVSATSDSIPNYREAIPETTPPPIGDTRSDVGGRVPVIIQAVPEFTLASDQPTAFPSETPEDLKEFEIQRATREAFGAEVQVAEVPISENQTRCHICGREFGAMKGLRTHLRLKHGINPPVSKEE